MGKTKASLQFKRNSGYLAFPAHVLPPATSVSARHRYFPHPLMRKIIYLVLGLLPNCGLTAMVHPKLTSDMVVVDLDVGELQEITLSNGARVRLGLLSLDEKRDDLTHAVRDANARVTVNGIPLTISSANYNLPITVEPSGVQIDCPVTQAYLSASKPENAWALKKAARFRLWPAGTNWMKPGTFAYPVKQRWFASATQMANEPVYVDGGEIPGPKATSYHSGLDFGGAEGQVEIVAATDGLVVSAGGEILPGQAGSPAQKRSDSIYLLDERDWYHRYSHLQTIDVKPGQHVKMGQHLGILGKEGGSGGWSHMHFEVISRQPSGDWGIQDGYAYIWEAWVKESSAELIAVARPHHLAKVGERVTLDGRKSWTKHDRIIRYEWTFTDATTATGEVVERIYVKPGTYSEILKITDANGRQAWDFCIIQVLDPGRPAQLPPSIHAAYHPTTGLKSGDTVVFKVRTFRSQPTGETWNFGDGSPLVNVHSDANSVMHAKDGYAVTTHSYTKPGYYVARVDHTNARGEPAVAHVMVEIK